MQNFLSEEDLKNWLDKIGEKPYRLKQIWQGIFRDLAESWEEITTLSEALREKLADEIWFPKLEIIEEKVSIDKQVKKILFELEDGGKTEAVLLDHYGKRTTVCVSTMTGCPLGCKFCATGRQGAGRNLTADEIVAQVLHFARELRKEDRSVTNVVMMGMGEPFLNYENTIAALELLKNQQAMNLAQRHLTVSTAGVVPGIKRFAEDGGQVCLALSLHAPNQELREKIMPVAKKWKMDELMTAIDEYVEKTNRRVFYEYIMLEGINDSLTRADELGKLLKKRLAHVNLIPFNATEGGYKSSSKEQMRRFQERLEKYKVPSTIRASLGDDIDAACGQLRGKQGDCHPRA